MQKKKCLGIALVAVAALTLSACSGGDSGGGGTDSGPTKISFAYWGNNSESATIESMVKAFEKANPDIDVQLNWIQSDYEQKLKISIAGGTQPTVAQINNYTLSGFSAAFETIDADNSAYYNDDVLKGMKVKGEVKAIPYVAKAKVMAINTKVFEAAGVEVPPADKVLSIDEFQALAKRLTSGSGNKKVFGSSQLWYYNWLVTSGGGVFNADEKRCTLNTPVAVKAAEDVIASQAANGFAPTSLDVEGQDMFDWLSIGRLAMLPDVGPWDIPKLVEKNDPNIKLMPAPGKGQPMEVTGLGISAKATKEERKAATTFTKFMSTSPDAQGLLTTKEASLGLPVIEASLEKVPAIAPELNLAVYVKSAKESVVLTGLKDPTFEGQLAKALLDRTALGAGHEDPAVVLAEFNEKCQSLLDEK